MLKSNSELAILEKGQLVFTNLESQPQLSGTMAEYGYDESVLDDGRQTLKEARDFYEGSRKEALESKVAYQLFSDFREDIDGRYRLLRKKAKVVFRNEPLILEDLQVRGDIPDAYLNWLDCVRQYCMSYISSKEIQARLSRLKVINAEVEKIQVDLKELVLSRAAYIKERGEAQHATILKDEAMARLERWLREFYAVAKIALDDQPQLLETFGIVVKR
ncbi:MAG: hypothetical protein MI866_18795 [Bacteroidales bacterium]|nr:hypothetical protein [Bacteroidales bacterium]